MPTIHNYSQLFTYLSTMSMPLQDVKICEVVYDITLDISSVRERYVRIGVNDITGFEFHEWWYIDKI